MDVVVGLDSGTTATKAVAATTSGEVRAVAAVGYPLLVPAPGRAELDANAVCSAVIEALVAVTGRLHARGDRVVGICLSAAMHGLVPLDRDGTPTGNLITWADGRAAEQARALRAQSAGATAHSLHQRTGTPVHPMSPLLKLMWLVEHDPELLHGTDRWGGVKELMITALCGSGPVVDLSCASATGLLDIHTRRWDTEALGLAGVARHQLPVIVATTARLGPLRSGVATAAGLPADTPLVIGASDGVLANLGVGAVTPGVGAVSLGTSGAIRAVRSKPAVDRAGRLFCYALTEDRWVLGGAVNNGGSVVRWAGNAFGVPDPSQPAERGGRERPDGSDTADTTDTAAANARDALLVQEAERAPAGSAGLLCLPYLLGERAPWWRPGMSGAYLGLRRDHRRAHLVRAAIEGVCQQLALVHDALSDAEVPLTEVRATGGAVNSPLWVATLASTLDLPVRLADSAEGTGLGACLLGHHALGSFPDLNAAATLITVGKPVLPVPADAARYRKTRPLIETATRALAEVFPQLRELADQPSHDETLPGG